MHTVMINDLNMRKVCAKMIPKLTWMKVFKLSLTFHTILLSGTKHSYLSTTRTQSGRVPDNTLRRPQIKNINNEQVRSENNARLFRRYGVCCPQGIVISRQKTVNAVITWCFREIQIDGPSCAKRQRRYLSYSQSSFTVSKWLQQIYFWFRELRPLSKVFILAALRWIKLAWRLL